MFAKRVKYNREDCLEALRAEAVDGRLSYQQYRESGRRPSFPVIKKHFGSFAHARQEAGLKPPKKRPKRVRTYTDEDILSALKSAASEQEDGRLSADQYQASGYKPSVYTVAERFGTWLAALKAAGLKSPGRGRPKKKPARKLYQSRKKRLETLGPPLRPRPVKWRPCLRCEENFPSEGPHNRLCERCRYLNSKQPEPTAKWHGQKPKRRDCSYA